MYQRMLTQRRNDATVGIAESDVSYRCAAA